MSRNVTKPKLFLKAADEVVKQQSAQVNNGPNSFAAQTDSNAQPNQATSSQASERTVQSNQATAAQSSEQTIVDEIKQAFDDGESVSDAQIIQLFEYLKINNPAILSPEIDTNSINEELHKYFSDDLSSQLMINLKLKELVQINHFKEYSLNKENLGEIIKDYFRYIEGRDPKENYQFSQAYFVAYSMLLPKSNSEYALSNLVRGIERTIAEHSVDPRLLYRFYISLLCRANNHWKNSGSQNPIREFVTKYQATILSQLSALANPANKQSNEKVITYKQLWDLLLITQQELKKSQNLVSSQDFQGWLQLMGRIINSILVKQPEQKEGNIKVISDIINSILQYKMQAANRQTNSNDATWYLLVKAQFLHSIRNLQQRDARYVTAETIRSINSAWAENQSKFTEEMNNKQTQQQATAFASEFLNNCMHIVFSHNTLAALPDRDRQNVLANLKALFKLTRLTHQSEDTLADKLENALKACHDNQTTIDNKQQYVADFIQQLQDELGRKNNTSFDEQLLEPAISAINNMMESIRPYADESKFTHLIKQYDGLLHAINDKKSAEGESLNLLQQLSPATLKRTALNVTWLFGSGREAGQVNPSAQINKGYFYYSAETMKIQRHLYMAYMDKATSNKPITYGAMPAYEVNKWLLDSFDEVVHEPAFYQDFIKRQQCQTKNSQSNDKRSLKSNEQTPRQAIVDRIVNQGLRSSFNALHIAGIMQNEIERYNNNPEEQQSSQQNQTKKRNQVAPEESIPKTAYDNIQNILRSDEVNSKLKERNNSQSLGNIVRSLVGLKALNQETKQLKNHYLKHYLQKDGYLKKDENGKRHFYLKNDYARSLTFEPQNVYKITEQAVEQLLADEPMTDVYNQLDAMFKQPRVGQTVFMKTLQDNPDQAAQVIDKLSQIPNQDKRDEYLQVFFQKGWSQTRNKRVEAFLNNDQLKSLAFELHCDGKLPKGCHAQKVINNEVDKIKADRENYIVGYLNNHLRKDGFVDKVIKQDIKQDCTPYLKFILQKHQNGEISQVNKYKMMLQVFQDALGEILSHQDVLSPEKIQKFLEAIKSALRQISSPNESLEQLAHDDLATFSTYLAYKEKFDEKFNKIYANRQGLKVDDVTHLLNEYALFKKGVCFSNNDRSLTKIMKLIEGKESFQKLSKIEKQEYYVSCVIAAYADEQDNDNNVDQQQVKDILKNNTINDLTVIERYLQPSSHDNNWSAESRLIVFQKVFTNLAQNKDQDQQKCREVFEQFCNQRHRGLTLGQYYQYAEQLFIFANQQDWLVHADIKEGLQKLADNLSQKIDNLYSKYDVLQNWQQKQYGQYNESVNQLIGYIKNMQASVVESLDQRRDSTANEVMASNAAVISASDGQDSTNNARVSDNSISQLSRNDNRLSGSGASDRRDSLGHVGYSDSDENRHCQTPRSISSNEKTQSRTSSMTKEKRRAYSGSYVHPASNNEEFQTPSKKRNSISESNRGSRELSSHSVLTELSKCSKRTDPNTEVLNQEQPEGHNKDGVEENLGDRFAAATGPSCTR